MPSVIGDLPFFPRRLLNVATEHAIGLRRAVIGDELFLLGILELDGEQPARRALESDGLTSERLLPEIRTAGDAAANQEAGGGGLTFSPASYMLLGRCQGFAAALGEGPITHEHVLMALLWDPQSTSSQVLWRLGHDRGRVLDRLRDQGVAVPSSALPPQREIERGERVWFGRDQVRRVLDHVRLHLSPETTWGFNYEDDRAWVWTEAHVDIQSLVDDALAAR
ncbi:MAG TPA: Clp protease N-terminal domain-containing protein [Solirubrobacteraceae bacterium]|jgi:hypothetical protein|nr:Clp protease N-terminal domain-containing protein [Solirubrobacteraceae bacterium]